MINIKELKKQVNKRLLEKSLFRIKVIKIKIKNVRLKYIYDTVVIVMYLLGSKRQYLRLYYSNLENKKMAPIVITNTILNIIESGHMDICFNRDQYTDMELMELSGLAHCSLLRRLASRALYIRDV